MKNWVCNHPRGSGKQKCKKPWTKTRASFKLKKKVGTKTRGSLEKEELANTGMDHGDLRYGHLSITLVSKTLSGWHNRRRYQPCYYFIPVPMPVPASNAHWEPVFYTIKGPGSGTDESFKRTQYQDHASTKFLKRVPNTRRRLICMFSSWHQTITDMHFYLKI